MAYPPIVKEEDLGVRTGKLAAALKLARGQIVAGNKCNALVRDTYGSRP